MLEFKGCGNDLSCLLKVCHFACGNGLHHQVSDGGCFLGTCGHGNSACIGGHLAEELILGSAANHMDHLGVATHKLLNRFGSFAVLQSKAFVNASDHLANRFGNRLTCAAAVCPHLFGHVAGGCKGCIVGVDKAAQRLAFLCPSFHLGKAVFVALPSPLTAGFLNQPKSHNIFQETDGTHGTALVCKVQFFGLRIDQGIFQLGSHQGPGTAADVNKVLFLCGNCNNCACGIVRRHGNDLGIGLSGLTQDLRQKLSDLVDSVEIDERRQSISVETGLGLMEAMVRDIAQFGCIRNVDTQSEIHERFNSDNKYFDKLIKRYILDSEHWTLVRCVPSADVLSEKKIYMDKRLATESERLHSVDGAYGELERHVAAFMEYLSAPDSPEAVASIPHLSLSDIGRENRLVDIEKREATVKNGKKIESLVYGGNSLGIILAGLVFDLKKIPTEDLFYATCLGRALFSLPTEKHTAEELTDLWVKYKAQTSAKTSSVHITDGACVTMDLRLNIPVESIADASALLNECMTSVKFDREIVTRLFSNATATKDNMIWSGNQTAANYASRCLNIADAYRDLLSGVSFYNRLKSIADSISDKSGSYSENVDTLIAGMERTARVLFESTTPKAYFIGDEAAYEDWRSSLSHMDICTEDEIDDYDIVLPDAMARALAVSGDVNYCAKVYDAKANGFEVTNRYLPVCRYIYGKYMWDEVRAKGGAYGAGVSVTRFGLVKMYSYRDPRVKETYDIYSALPDWLDNNLPDADEIEKNIISTAGTTCFAPQSILDAGVDALVRYMRGKTADGTWNILTELFDTTEQDFRDFAEMIRRLDKDNAGVLSAVGNHTRLAESELFAEITEL